MTTATFNEWLREDVVVDAKTGERFKVTVVSADAMRLVLPDPGYWEMRGPGGEWKPWRPPEDDG